MGYWCSPDSSSGRAQLIALMPHENSSYAICWAFNGLSCNMLFITVDVNYISLIHYFDSKSEANTSMQKSREKRQAIRILLIGFGVCICWGHPYKKMYALMVDIVRFLGYSSVNEQCVDAQNICSWLFAIPSNGVTLWY